MYRRGIRVLRYKLFSNVIFIDGEKSNENISVEIFLMSFVIIEDFCRVVYPSTVGDYRFHT